MIKLRIPIFTDEYAVNVYIGAKKDIVPAAAKYTGEDCKRIGKAMEHSRGRAFDCFPRQ
jgi:hypothetical protein